MDRTSSKEARAGKLPGHVWWLAAAAVVAVAAFVAVGQLSGSPDALGQAAPTETATPDTPVAPTDTPEAPTATVEATGTVAATALPPTGSGPTDHSGGGIAPWAVFAVIAAAAVALTGLVALRRRA